MTRKICVGLCACLFILPMRLKADAIFSGLGPFESDPKPGADFELTSVAAASGHLLPENPDPVALSILSNSGRWSGCVVKDSFFLLRSSLCFLLFTPDPTVTADSVMRLPLAGEQLLLVLSTPEPRPSLPPKPQAQPRMKKTVERKSTEPVSCYAVQVGAYEDRAEGAAMLKKLLMKKDFPQQMTLSQVMTRDKTLWRLRVLATSRLDALKVSGRLLGEEGIKAWIVSIPCS